MRGGVSLNCIFTLINKLRDLVVQYLVVAVERLQMVAYVVREVVLEVEVVLLAVEVND